MSNNKNRESKIFTTQEDARESIIDLPKVETQEAKPKNPNTIQDRVQDLYEEGKTINEIASLLHITETKVYGILGALKILTFWDQSKKVMAGNWFKAIVAGITAVVIASFITFIPVVSTVTGVTVGTAFLYTTANVLLALGAIVFWTIMEYYLGEAIFTSASE